jgi:uncharacterized membrane protein YgdD (TMEM256/DUF423 family)
MVLMIGAVLGFISVAFGAYAEHGLREQVTEEHFRNLMTAIRYNQIHAVILSVIGLTFMSNGKFANVISAKLSALLFILGTILFSFSIYLSITFNIPMLLNIAPIGGISIMVAWTMLAVAGYQVWKSNMIRY